MIGESSRLSAMGVREMRMLRCDCVVNQGRLREQARSHKVL